MKNNELGRSMIEMIGVIAIGGVLSVGGATGYGTLINRHRINQSIEQISLISSKLSLNGSEGNDYRNLSNYAAYKYNALPKEIISDSCTSDACELRNPFSGSITISAANLGIIESGTSSDDQAYTIQYTGLSRKECASLATNNWGNSENSSFIGLVVGNVSGLATDARNLYQGCEGMSSGLTNNHMAACSRGTTVPVPMPPAIAAQACNCSGNYCSIVLKYY